MTGKFGMAVAGALAACTVTLASAQTGVPMDAGDTISTLSTDSAITPEQRARLAMKLKLIDQIVRAAEPDMQANNIGLDQKRWLLERLYSAPLEAIQKMGVRAVLRRRRLRYRGREPTRRRSAPASPISSTGRWPPAATSTRATSVE